MDKFEHAYNILIGGLVALAIDDLEKYLFVVTHSGRGVFELKSGNKITRNSEIIYPDKGKILGIKPFPENELDVIEYDFVNDIVLFSKSGSYKVLGGSSLIQVEKCI